MGRKDTRKLERIIQDYSTKSNAPKNGLEPARRSRYATGVFGLGVFALLGGFYLSGRGNNSELGRPEVPLVIENTHSVSLESEITFDEAYNNPDIRPVHVRQSARKIGIDLSTYDIQYDHDYSKFINWQFANQHLHPNVISTLDNGKFKITYVPAPLKKYDEVAVEKCADLQNPNGLMTTLWAFKLYASGQASPILVFDGAYETSKNSDSITGDVRELTFLSGLAHEYTHATDFRYGMHLPGMRAPLTQEEIARLISLDCFHLFAELHGFTAQAQFQSQYSHAVRSSESIRYSDYFSQLTHRYNARKTEFEQHGLTPIMESFFATMEIDPIHHQLLQQASNHK